MRLYKLKAPIIENMGTLSKNTFYFGKWTVLSVLIGLIVGTLGTIFGKSINYVTNIWSGHKWLLYLMPISGIAIVYIYKIFHQERNKGTNVVLDSISHDDIIPATTAPLIFISTLLTHVVGGSSGREGAALQLGGSVGGSIARVLKLDHTDQKIAIMAGMSACFSAIFGTPIAAAIFAMEVVSVGMFYYAAMIPCIFASLTGVAMSHIIGLSGEHFTLPIIPHISIHTAILICILAILCAAISILFCIIMHFAEHTYKHYFANPFVRIIVGSVIFIALTKIIGTYDYSGGGMGLIEECMEGNVHATSFLLKIIFTAICLGAGFKGGEIVPTFTVGATFGCLFGTLTGLPPALASACGMVALFVGVTNCPISSLIIACELFGFEALPYFALAIGICFTLSGHYSLYSSQLFTSKKTTLD